MTQQPDHTNLRAFSTPVSGTDLSRGEASERPLHVLFHIPRCAGQTIHHHLASHMPPERYLRVKKRKGLGRLFPRQYRLDDPLNPETVDVITGHWVGRSIERAFDDRPVVRSILLRDPVSQFLSYYNFRMMRYLSQGLRPYSLDIAYRARRRNFITNFILSTFAETPWPRLALMTGAEKHAAANRFLSECDFVGDYTRCDELMATLASDLGIPAQAEPRNTSKQWLERVEWTPLTESDLSPRMLETIKRDNLLDQMLWEAWKDAHLERIDHRTENVRGYGRLSRATAQASRLLNQVKRRLHRGWSGANGSNGASE